MKGLFIIYFDDIKGPVMDPNLSAITDQTIEITDKEAQRIYYSHDVGKGSTESYMEIKIDGKKIGSFYTGAKVRGKKAVVFNIVMEQNEEKDLFHGFAKKWSEWLFTELNAPERKIIDITRIIKDAEARQEAVDVTHEFFRVFSEESAWTALENYTNKKTKKEVGLKRVNQFKRFGIVDTDGAIQVKSASILDRTFNQRVLEDLKSKRKVPKTVKPNLVKKLIQLNQEAIDNVKSAKTTVEVRHLNKLQPHTIVKPLHDSIAFRIFSILNGHGVLTTSEIAYSLGYETETINSRIKYLEENGMVVSAHDESDIYICSPYVIHILVPRMDFLPTYSLDGAAAAPSADTKRSMMSDAQVALKAEIGKECEVVGVEFQKMFKLDVVEADLQAEPEVDEKALEESEIKKSRAKILQQLIKQPDSVQESKDVTGGLSFDRMGIYYNIRYKIRNHSPEVVNHIQVYLDIPNQFYIRKKKMGGDIEFDSNKKVVKIPLIEPNGASANFELIIEPVKCMDNSNLGGTYVYRDAKGNLSPAFALKTPTNPDGSPRSISIVCPIINTPKVAVKEEEFAKLSNWFNQKEVEGFAKRSIALPIKGRSSDPKEIFEKIKTLVELKNMMRVKQPVVYSEKPYSAEIIYYALSSLGLKAGYAYDILVQLKIDGATNLLTINALVQDSEKVSDNQGRVIGLLSRLWELIDDSSVRAILEEPLNDFYKSGIADALKSVAILSTEGKAPVVLQSHVKESAFDFSQSGVLDTCSGALASTTQAIGLSELEDSKLFFSKIASANRAIVVIVDKATNEELHPLLIRDLQSLSAYPEMLLEKNAIDKIVEVFTGVSEKKAEVAAEAIPEEIAEATPEEVAAEAAPEEVAEATPEEVAAEAAPEEVAEATPEEVAAEAAPEEVAEATPEEVAAEAAEEPAPPDVPEEKELTKEEQKQLKKEAEKKAKEEEKQAKEAEKKRKEEEKAAEKKRKEDEKEAEKKRKEEAAPESSEAMAEAAPESSEAVAPEEAIPEEPTQPEVPEGKELTKEEKKAAEKKRKEEEKQAKEAEKKRKEEEKAAEKKRKEEEKAAEKKRKEEEKAAQKKDKEEAAPESSEAVVEAAPESSEAVIEAAPEGTEDAKVEVQKQVDELMAEAEQLAEADKIEETIGKYQEIIKLFSSVGEEEKAKEIQQMVLRIMEKM